MKITEISIGMTETYTKTITDDDIKKFAALSGDHNPIHLDEVYCANTKHGKRVAHGLISASFFSAIFGTKLPGEGCLYVNQSLNFKRPVHIDDAVTATVVVTNVDLSKDRVFFDTVCKVNGKIVIDGVAELYLPRK
jgi:3-hydroxybutyryl-CoA dehydratase